MAPRVDPVATDETPPARADVVIIGGGIIGTSAALFLAEKGVSTVLCEKCHIAGEQSSRNWGWCRKMARDPREIPLVIESLRLWQGMNERVEAETGFRTCGIMYLAEKQDDLARLGGCLAEIAASIGDGATASGAELVDDSGVVAHDHFDASEWNVELFSNDLGEGRPVALSEVDLAGEGGDVAVGVHLDP